jgi:hypothetical protein
MGASVKTSNVMALAEKTLDQNCADITRAAGNENIQFEIPLNKIIGNKTAAYQL